MVLLALVLLIAPGCGGGEKRKATHKIRCPVRLEDGTPLTDAIVTFHPQDEADFSPFRPRGKVQPDGIALLTTYHPGDGIPEGDYTVTVVWPTPQEGKRREDTAEVDQLGERYKMPETSPLKRTVKRGAREIDPIVVSKPPHDPDA